MAAAHPVDWSPQLEHVLPFMLQGGHLTAEERLACFCSSKGMADVLLRHSACTRLAITLPDTSPAEAAGGSSSSASDSRCAEAHANTAQQLAAQSDNVTLVLHGGLLTLAACIWQSITSLQLRGIRLDQTSAIQLQLFRLPRLHTLSLRHCQMAPNTSSSATDQQHRSTSIRTLESCMCYTYSCLSMALQLLDPSQLQAVITDAVDDQEFEVLLSHPRLSRVQLSRLRLQVSHADKPCAWESLTLTAGASLEKLALMPLGGIQSCTVHGHLFVELSDTAGAMGSIGRVPQHWMFKANSTIASCFWEPEEPVFIVYFETDTGSWLSAPVTALVMQHLEPGTALILEGLSIGSPDVLASLAAAPATLHTLGLFCCKLEGLGNADAAATGVMARMPHVKHLVLCVATRNPLILLQWLRVFVAGVTRSMQLTLVVRACWGIPWSIFDHAELRQWVATHASEHVQVEFQVNDY